MAISLTNILTTHTLEAPSSLDRLLLPLFQRDTYPDREFHSPLQRNLQRILLTSSGLVGQDIRHLDKIWLIRILGDQRCDSMKSMYISSSETRVDHIVTIGRALRPFPRSKPSVPLSRHSAFRTRPSDLFFNPIAISLMSTAQPVA